MWWRERTTADTIMARASPNPRRTMLAVTLRPWAMALRPGVEREGRWTHRWVDEWTDLRVMGQMNRWRPETDKRIDRLDS